MEQSEQTTWITRLSEHDERYATSSQVQDEVHVLQKEHGVTVAYILNELCADKQHYTVTVASEHRGSIHPPTRLRLSQVTSRRIEKVCGTGCSRGSATSTKHLMKSEVFSSEKLGTLIGDYEQAAVDLRETRERLRDEWEDRRSCHRRADRLLGGLTGEGTRRARTLANVER